MFLNIIFCFIEEIIDTLDSTVENDEKLQRMSLKVILIKNN